MDCQKCGREIPSGKRYCPFCNAENVYDGSVNTPIRKPSRIGKWLKKAFKPMNIFIALLLLVIVFALILKK